MIYTFQNYILDVKRHELQDDSGLAVALRPKVFSLLILFLENPDTVISKEEVHNAVWPKRFVSEATLNSCLKELRKALNDNGKQKQFIKTVHGVGFRFLAPVACQQEAEPETETDSDTPALNAGSAHLNTEITDAAILPAEAFSAENRVLSVLRYRLDSQQLGDAEQAHALIRSTTKKLLDVIEHCEGVIAQQHSDGGLAVFGALTAQDDHARRAMHAANLLLEEVCGGDQESALQLHCAVSSGRAIVETQAEAPVSYSGKPFREVEVLCNHAVANNCVLGSESYRLLRADVRAVPLPELEDAWLLEATRNQRAGVPRQFKRNFSPHLGRDSELTILKKRLDLSLQGEGHCAVVSGNAGLGKTRLLQEFIKQHAGRSTVIELACVPYAQGTAYALLIGLLARLGGLLHSDVAEQKSQKLNALANALGEDADDASLCWHKLFNLPLPSLQRGLETPEALLGKTERYCRQILFAVAEHIVLVVEDTHWIDSSSQRWLKSVANRLSGQNLLLVLSCRPEPNTQWLAHLPGTRLSLLPLSQSECLRILEALPQAESISEQHQHIVERAAGNPFFLGELAIHVHADKSHIPDTVQAVIAARIDALRAGDKELLQILATLGEHSSIRLLLAITRRPVEQLEQALLRLQHAELILFDERRSAADVVFKHSLIQWVAYHCQLGERKKQVHHYVACAIESELPDSSLTHPELLAEHFTKAGEHRTARVYWQRAAATAKKRLAYAEALKCTQQGLDLFSSDELNEEELEAKLSLLRLHCDALMATEGYDIQRVNHVFAEVKALCRTLGDHASLFQVLTQERQFQLIAGRRLDVSLINRELLRHARRSKDLTMRAEAKASYSSQLLIYNKLAAAERCLLRCRELLDANAEALFVNFELHARVNSQLAWLCVNTNREQEALRYTEFAISAAEQSDTPFVIANTLAMAAEMHRLRMDPRTALSLADSCIDLCGTESLPFWLAAVKITRGWALCLADNDRAGIELIEQTIAEIKRKSTRVRLSDYLAALAEAYLHFREWNKVETTLSAALDWNAVHGTELSAQKLATLNTRLAMATNQN